MRDERMRSNTCYLEPVIIMVVLRRIVRSRLDKESMVDGIQ